RAVAFMLMPGKAADLSVLYAPTYRDVDHRSVGYGALSRDDADKLASSFDDVAEDVRFRVDDVLALSPSGFVRKTTATGVWRDGGGSFDRSVCTLSVFGTDGRVAGHETFDADRESEALARFDELAPGTTSRVVRRRVRTNV